MSQPVIYLLLALALLLPIIGAALLRVFAARLSPRLGISLASAMFAIAIASVVVLARSDATSLQLGRITLLLPVTAPSAFVVELPAAAPTPATVPTLPATNAPVGTSTATTATTTTRVTATATPASPTPTREAATPTTTSTPEPPTPTPAPPTPTFTPEPPAPTPEPAPAARQTYVVQAGDTLRSIAQRFNVSVSDLLAANNLTPADADRIRPGQELVIP